MSNVRPLREKQKSGLRKKLILVIFLLAILLVFMTKTLKIEAVVIVGATHYSAEEIKSALGIKEDSNILNLYFNANINYENYPYLENIEIDYGDYKVVTVYVEEKKIMGYLPYMSKYLCIDNDGNIIDYTDELDEDIAIIEGIDIHAFSMGEKIDVSETIINSCLMFYQAEQQYSLEIDRIILTNNDLSDIIIYINDIKILFGGMDDFNSKFQYLSNSLPNIVSSGSGTFDLENKVLLNF
jgi:cell division septal protein FtsQ